MRAFAPLHPWALSCLLALLIFAPSADAGRWITAHVDPGTFDAASSNRVNAFVEFEGDLVVGGQFDGIDGVAAQNVARWNGSSWSAMGSGQPCNEVFDLVVWDRDGNGEGELYALGFFGDDGVCTMPGSGPLNGPDRILLQWDGSNWDPVGPRAGGAAFRSMAVFGGQLYIGGEIGLGQVDTDGNGQPVTRTAANLLRWDGISLDHFDVLEHLGGVLNTSLPCALPAASSGIYDMVVFDDGIQGAALYVGGAFSEAIDTVASPIENTLGIARFDGTSWDDVLGGLADVSPCGTPECPLFQVCDRHAEQVCGVRALTVFDNSLYVGGNFRYVGDEECSRTPNFVDARNVVRYDGDWHPLTDIDNGEPGVGTLPETGLPETLGTVQALTVAPGFIDTDLIVPSFLYVGGTFTETGRVETTPGKEVHNIASWDGARFRALGCGVTVPGGGAVKALWPYPYALSSGMAPGPSEVHVGGQFTEVDNAECTEAPAVLPVRDIARWDNHRAATCPADFNNDHVVNITDLLALQAAWGLCPPGPCIGDVDGDGQVNVTDQNALLAAWGPCPGFAVPEL